MKKVVFLTCLFFSLTKVYSQDRNYGFAVGFYSGIKVEYFTYQGDFNGKTFFYTDAAEIFVPKIEPGIAYGLQLGFKFRGASWDFGYQLSSHHYSHENGYSGTMLIHLIKCSGFTVYLNPPKKIRPYLGFDFSSTWMHIKDGAYGIDSYSGQNDKSYYGGLIFGLGAGLELNISKKFSFHLESIPSWLFLTDVKGITKKYWEVEKFSSFRPNISAGLYYNF
ncbi:MAG: hypothetical protein R6W78_15690 [Bacteroidales bacterium]